MATAQASAGHTRECLQLLKRIGLVHRGDEIVIGAVVGEPTVVPGAEHESSVDRRDLLVKDVFLTR